MFRPVDTRLAPTIVMAVLTVLAPRLAAQVNAPSPLGRMVDIGDGQRIHLNCHGSGTPTVVLEGGTGDFSFIWALVEPGVARFARVCSYDRGGYAWSDPGAEPRTFSQLALELKTALDRAGEPAPFVLVGQSYGGLLVRGIARRYPAEVRGMVLVDAVHEDQRVVIQHQPVRLRDLAKGRPEPEPRIARGAAGPPSIPPATGALEEPLDRLPVPIQALWRWAGPNVGTAQGREQDWSPEEFRRMHDERLTNRRTLGEMPLVVLSRSSGGYSAGMSISADSLEADRRAQQRDLGLLSTHSSQRFVAAGHNIHLEAPQLVVDAIREVVDQVRKSR